MFVSSKCPICNEDASTWIRSVSAIMNEEYFNRKFVLVKTKRKEYIY